MVLQTISMDALDDFVVLVFRDDKLGLLGLWLTKVLLLRDLGKVIFTLIVSCLHLFTLKVAC